MDKPTLVAIYARVSTSEQNPEAQLLALREYSAHRASPYIRSTSIMLAARWNSAKPSTRTTVLIAN